MVKIAPSLLSANFNNLEHDIRKIERAGADYLHLDIMDGKFVPNITFGPVVVKGLSAISMLPLDVHLMIYEPEKFVEEFTKIGAHIVTIQYEATPHLDRVLNLVKDLGAIPSVAINPATPIECIYPVLPIVKQVLIMSVNPGFGGQTFIPYCLEKIKALKKYIQDNNLQVDIEVDGGVTEANAKQIVAAGVEVLVAGSAVFGSTDINKTIAVLKAL